MSCSIGNQCFASCEDKNSRCLNDVVGTSNYCLKHQNKATKLYNEYKYLSNRVNKLKIKELDIISLLKAYSLINKTYIARLNHRRYAIAPECYDEGHNYQFEKLKKMLKKVEFLLSKSYYLKNDTKIESNSSSSSENNNRPILVSKNINPKKERKERIAYEKEVDEWIKIYTIQNKLIITERKKLSELTLDLLVNLYSQIYKPGEKFNLIVLAMATFNVTRTLRTIGYFDKDFKPNECSCGCGEIIEYDLRMGCKCIKNMCCIYEYLMMMKINNLKTFYGEMLLNKNKLLPFLYDIKKFVIIHDDFALYPPYELEWNPTIKNFFITPKEKEFGISDIRRMQIVDRMKQKHRIKQNELIELQNIVYDN